MKQKDVSKGLKLRCKIIEENGAVAKLQNKKAPGHY